MRRFHLAFVAVAASSLFALACSGSPGSSSATGAQGNCTGDGCASSNPGIAGDPSTSGDAGANPAPNVPPPPPPPPGCDGSKLPTEDACVVNESYGIFVSSSRGNTQGTGSRTQPLASINAALVAAKASNRRVYVCAESYAEQVKLVDGVAMFGGFDCGAWTVGAVRAKIAPSASPAVRADDIASPTRVDSFEIVGPDMSGGTNGESSIAMIANKSPGVAIVRSIVRAQAAAAGAKGADGAVVSNVGNINAQDGVYASGALCPKASCPSWTETAGGVADCRVAGVAVASLNGGHGGFGGKGGAHVYSTSPLSPGWKVNGPESGEALSSSTAQGGSAGQPNGASGAAGAAGANGTNGASFGQFVAASYVPADATDAQDGTPGQGGGGGEGEAIGARTVTDTSAMQFASSGGAGGAGGCAGRGGKGGGGGGASVALLASDSPLSLKDAILETGAGGRGGLGGGGSGGTGGGAAGAAAAHVVTDSFGVPRLVVVSGLGGAGGPGGYGGVGGAGGGGPSVAIVFRGAEPTRTQVTVKLGAGGASAGNAGLSAETHQVP